MINDNDTLLHTLRSLSYLSQLRLRCNISNELEALEAHGKSLYLTFLEVEQWPQVSATLDTFPPEFQRDFLRAYTAVRIGAPTPFFPSIGGSWWAWPPPLPALLALDPSGELEWVALPAGNFWAENFEGV